MLNANIELTLEQFEDQFRPRRNPSVDEDDSFNGTLFETYGDDLEFVRASAIANPGTVWTYMEDGEGGTMIGDGLHTVNRIGYFVTEIPAKEGVSYTVDRSPCEPEDEFTLT